MLSTDRHKCRLPTCCQGHNVGNWLFSQTKQGSVGAGLFVLFSALDKLIQNAACANANRSWCWHVASRRLQHISDIRDISDISDTSYASRSAAQILQHKSVSEKILTSRQRFSFYDTCVVQ